MSIFNKRIFGFAAVVFGILVSATAVAHTDGIYNPTANSVGDTQGIDSNAAAAVGGGCAQATTFLARTSGLNGTETTAYTTMICGMVTDGTWSLLDVLHIFATNTTTTANLNLVSTSFPLTPHGSITFTADRGYAGDGSTGYLSSTFVSNAGGTNYVLNSASLGAYLLTSSAASNASVTMYSNTSFTSNDQIQFIPLSGVNLSVSLNNTDPNKANFANANRQGSYVASRTAAGANSISVYKNGVSLGAAAGGATSGLNSNPVFFLAADTNGSPANFSTDQVASVFLGGGLTTAQQGTISSRINAYMTAVGANVY